VVRNKRRTRRTGFDIRLTPDAERHLEFLSARERAIVLDAIEASLRYEPTVERRNRKRLRPNPLAPWELRVADLRVYFEPRMSPTRTVVVVAVGVKDRTALRIGGEEVDLG
jgi:mRNA-degrading endonuclease RelE of RelBE toxin-antitoxin system